jgi:hypothetical protein
MKRKFNIYKLMAFFLVFILFSSLFTQGAGSVVLAAENPSKTVFEGKIGVDETTDEADFGENDDNLAWQVGENTYTAFEEAYRAAPEGATLVLMRNVTLTETIVVDREIVIDLNGHVLNRGATGGNSNVITIGTGGKLTIEDSEPGTSHSGTVNTEGLWVWNQSSTEEETGSQMIAGGIITGGYAETTGGGIVINGGGCLIMHGGTIAGNCSKTFSGGGLRVDLGSAELEGVDVCYNAAENGGGLYSTDVLCVKGGNIFYNRATADGGGIGVWGGTTTLKNVKVKGNTAKDSSRTAIYVMNNNSWLYLRGAATRIEGAVTAGNNVNERIHLSNKLRWSGNTIEAVTQSSQNSVTQAERIAAAIGRTIVGSEAAISGTAGIGRSIASTMANIEAIATVNSVLGSLKVITNGAMSIIRRCTIDTKARDPVPAFVRSDYWYLKQIALSLQRAVQPAENILSRMLAQLHQQLPRLPSQNSPIALLPGFGYNKHIAI